MIGGILLSIGQNFAYGGEITLVGMGVVFVGLILLVFITWLMSKLIASFSKQPAASAASAPSGAALNQASTPAMPAVQKGERSAVIAAAIACAMGTEVRGLRIHSIRKID